MSRSRRMYDCLMPFWPWGKALNHMANRPLVGRLLRPLFSAEGNEAMIIPVQEAIRGTDSIVLPLQLLTPLIQSATARTILHECMCRRGEKCQAYPPSIGCIFLGDGAADIGANMGRLVDSNAALTHVEEAMKAGLVPMVVHSSFDTWLLGIPYDRCLAVCLCCDCCCSVRHGLKLGPEAFWDTVHRLPGLSIVVDAACTGCGTCQAVCHVGAIDIHHGQARVGAACKGCGLCVDACPTGAIGLHVDAAANMPDQLLESFRRRTTIGPAAHQPFDARRGSVPPDEQDDRKTTT